MAYHPDVRLEKGNEALGFCGDADGHQTADVAPGAAQGDAGHRPGVAVKGHAQRGKMLLEVLLGSGDSSPHERKACLHRRFFFKGTCFVWVVQAANDPGGICPLLFG